MIKCRVLLEGWRFHSDVFWYRRGWADLTAHPRWDTWNQDHGFRADEVRVAMEKFDMEGLDSITLVAP